MRVLLLWSPVSQAVFFRDKETFPAWGRTEGRPTFHGEYWTPLNTPTNRADHQHRDIKDSSIWLITSPRSGIMKVQGWRLR